MSKKGFTLIEVLAVIIILGIIGAIIYPKITNTINNSEDNTYMLSTQGLVESLNSYVMDKKATLTPFSGCTYNFDIKVSDCDGFSYNGNLPTGGSVTVDSDGNVNGYVYFGDDDIYNISNNDVVVSEQVQDDDFMIDNVDYFFDYNDFNDGDVVWKNKINEQNNINIVGAIKSSSSVDLYGTSSSHGYIDLNASVNQTRYVVLKGEIVSDSTYRHYFSSYNSASSGHALSLLSNSGYMKVDTYSNSINSSISDNKFHLYVIVVNGDKVNLYIDGNYIGETVISSASYGNKITLGYTEQFGYNTTNRLTSFKFIAISANTVHSNAEVIENSNKIMEEYGL